MLLTLSGERPVRRSDMDSVHPATLSDRSLAVQQEGTAKLQTPDKRPDAMATTSWQEEVGIGVIPA